MSKMDDLRAMREARYEQARARAGNPATRAAASVPKRSAAPAAAPTATTDPSEAPSEALCGHRNMGGRTCTREAGHAAKSHRYA
jgi:hypothetical protein